MSAEGRDSRDRNVRTGSIKERITGAWDVSDEAARLPAWAWAEVVYEHGQHWINASNGAQWFVVRASGPGSIDGFAFEQVSEGEE